MVAATVVLLVGLLAGSALSQPPPPAPPPPFGFSTAFGSHMVLQASHGNPNQRAVVWGIVEDPSSTVTVEFNNKKYSTSFVHHFNQLFWRTTLDPMPASTKAYSITATDGTHTVKLDDVLFGDVVVCSGQSNMAFLLQNAFNGSELVQSANEYPHIRLYTSKKESENTPIAYQHNIEEPWSVCNNISISMNNKPHWGPPDPANDDNWLYMSAVCFLYGREIFKARQYPIGLYNTNWGGTPVEFWSPSSSLAACGVKNAKNGGAFNGMITPLLNVTIHSVIWYQGEANAHAYAEYACTFPGMVEAWRQAWYEGTGGATDPSFPFGFVQLAGDVSSTLEFPMLRLAQTRNQTYVTNWHNVFMAVAMDLGDSHSPYGSVHSRYKTDVGLRLGQAGRAVAYGENVPWTGPMVTGAAAHSDGTVTISFNASDAAGIRVNASAPNFEVCSGDNNTCNAFELTNWNLVTVKSVTATSVTLAPPAEAAVNGQSQWVRYAWRSYPCEYKQCAIYGRTTNLPAAPFLLELAGQ